MIALLFAFSILSIRRFSDLNHEILFWLALVVTSQILGFGFGVGPILSGVMLSAFFIVRIVRGSWATGREFIVQLFMALPFLLVATMPTRFLDAGRYYNQTVRWFIEGIPLGLANFDLYLIQASGAHSMEAMLTSITITGYDVLVPLVSTLLIVRSASSWDHKIPRLIALFIIYAILVQFAQTSSPDLLGIALIIALSANGNQRIANSTLAIGAAVLPVIKLAFVPVSLLWLILFLLKNQYKCALIITAGGIFCAMKIFWVSGWLPLLGIMEVPWHIQMSDLEILSEATSGDVSGNRGSYIISGMRWRYLDAAVIAGYLAIVLVNRKNLARYDFIALLLTGIVALVFIPQARFILPLVLLTLLKVSGNSIPNIHSYKHAMFALFIGMIAILPHYPTWINDERVSHFLDFSGYKNIRWLVPSSNWRIETLEMESADGSFQYHKPANDFQCFDGDFPCTTYSPDRENAELSYNEASRMFFWKLRNE
ncbi:hypothetical protein [Phaeocystidibacter luteus]|uniref:DUF8201 domain-containing protein n=1 Tax=Phaeocystidibacter luteus TaxID=911197 RepID=A0A6N6RLB9_9FLAO|nr:hypothetical protein [Phaeocystidibacter luteus]KAB2814339.1 hypothetical protein F8C67_00990 [Phaeocystidibacter luteus]